MPKLACCMSVTLMMLLPEEALSQFHQIQEEHNDSSIGNPPQKVFPTIGINIGAAHQVTQTEEGDNSDTFLALDLTLGLTFRVGENIRLGGKASGGAIIEEGAYLFIPVPTEGHVLSDIAGVLEFNFNQGANLGLELGAAQYSSLQYRPMVGGYLQIPVGRSKINRYLSLSINYQAPTETNDESDPERMFLFRLGYVWAF